MSKTLKFTLLLINIIIFISHAQSANAGAYVSAKVGYSTISSRIDLADFSYMNSKDVGSFAGGIAVGYSLFLPLRVELEYLMFADSTEDVNNGLNTKFGETSFGMSTLMVNAYYELRIVPLFTPFVGVGFGLAFADAEMTNFAKNLSTGVISNPSSAKANETLVAWSLSVGVTTPEINNLSAEIGYKFFSIASMDTDSLTSGSAIASSVGLDDLYSHLFYVGLRYSF